jgi:hypothetical protein
MGERLKRDILRVLAERSPKWLRPSLIVKALSQYDAVDIETGIEALVNESVLEKTIIWKNYGPAGGDAYVRLLTEAQT